MDNALKRLAQQDSLLNELIDKYKDVSLDGNYMKGGDSFFYDLITSIISQQLSSKVAETICKRVNDLFNGEINADNCLSASDEDFRRVGLSKQKISYIRGLSQAVKDKVIQLDRINELCDEEVISQLTSVKGIGRWTAEMFLIFSLNRPDVFSFGDKGLLNAMKKLYGENLTPLRQQEIVEGYKPYRTYACLLLWKSLDN